jgi:HlyD family secretion protein
MRKKILIVAVLAVVLVTAGFFLLGGPNGGDEASLPNLHPVRATIVDKALAVGTIEPENEISVKSKVSGAVARIFADAGTYVRAGQPLLEVRPEPTPLELTEAKRNAELADVELASIRKDRVRQESLVRKGLISDREYDEFLRRFEESELRLKLAQERLALLEEGRVTIGGTNIESIIKAPIDGFVLSKTVEVGDPVTPLTSFQEGTVLMKMANMERLVFKGTVDEIDVGRLREGMETQIKVGARPADTVVGRLSRISLKAERRENATVFPIEILIPKASNTMLRAGYSANAHIIIRRKDGVLTVPERVVTFRNDSAFVRVARGPAGSEERRIVTGLSDAINVEVVEGLTEQDEVLEKPVKKIE